MNIKFAVAVVILQLFAHSAIAQKNELKFNLVEGNNGKPLSKINAITQDRYGYMWFASPGDKCIYRYDGSKLVAYRHDESNSQSLGVINFEAIHADSAGMIWIGGQGLDQYNPVTGIFKHYRHVQNDTGSLTSDGVYAIITDFQGRLWVGTDKGLDCLDEKTGKFIHYRNVPGNRKSLSSNVVWRLYVDRQGVLWIATGYPWYKREPEDGGLNRLEPDGTFTRFMHDPNDPHSLINNKVAAMYEDSRGVFWVGTSGDGLHTMDRKTGKFERHLFDPANPAKLSRPALKPGDYHDKITFINEDSTGAIWIGSFSSGINRYDPKTKKITHYLQYDGVPDSTTWTTFTSTDGVVWLSTERPALYKVNPFHQTINSVPTAAYASYFMEDREGYLWVSTLTDGLLQLDQHNNLIRKFKQNPSDPAGLPADDVGPLFQNKDDSIMWVGTRNGIRVFNKITQQFSRFNDDGNLRDAKDSGFVKIIRDKQGMIWFTRWGLGLVAYNTKDNSFQHFLPDAKDSLSIASNLLNSVLEDRSGVLWVSGIGGINRLNRETGRFKHYMRETFITYLYEDSEGTLWAGTEKGLYRYNQKDDRFASFFDPQSEMNALAVGGIIEDNSKNLWLTSLSAIIKINTVTRQVFSYGNKFGVIPNSMKPWSHTYKNSKGQLFIGHDNGFYLFYPEELAVKTGFNINITDFFINSFPVLPGAESPIQKPVEEISYLDLHYDQNNLAFNFSAIDYRQPEAIRYFTMLENYDNLWREVKGEKSSNYFNVSPGKYIYRIKAFNSDGVTIEKAISIYINPPWWQTWWFRSLAVFFAAALLYGFIQYRSRNLKLRNLVLEKKVNERTNELNNSLAELKMTQEQLIQAEKMASLGELTSGIAHEIKNPLNFINNFSELNLELIAEIEGEQIPELDETGKAEITENIKTLKKNSEKINHHSKRIDAIVKGMLQHSRLGNSQKERININDICDESLKLAYHGFRAKEKTFNAFFETHFDDRVPGIMIIPQDVSRVMLNLINNAFYAVNQKQNLIQSESLADAVAVESLYKPLVIVRTKLSGNKIIITISDNGLGIPSPIINKIFQPFFTTKPTGEGTGLGLSMSYDIITKGHGGELRVKSKEGVGTDFEIVLPV